MANNNKFRIPLEDVESEHCALIVDNGLAKLNGVESHRVELNNKEAVIETQNRETVSEAVKTIQDLGYGVPTVKISFPVLQMTVSVRPSTYFLIKKVFLALWQKDETSLHRKGETEIYR